MKLIENVAIYQIPDMNQPDLEEIVLLFIYSTPHEPLVPAACAGGACSASISPGVHAAGKNPNGTVARFPLGFNHQNLKLLIPTFASLELQGSNSWGTGHLNSFRT